MNPKYPTPTPSVSPRIILPHSGYRKLIAYRKSEVIYQGTVMFCRRFLDARRDRTVDQMTQAARSCKQNIAEGSAAVAVSLETQLKLTGVAKASLDELLEDVLDWLEAHGKERWRADDPRAVRVRLFARDHADWEDWRETFETADGETLCNVLAVLVHQCRTLLERLMERQAADFRANGGIRERMRAARNASRSEGWELALHSLLDAAGDPAELASREAMVVSAIHRMAGEARRRKGWG